MSLIEDKFIRPIEGWVTDQTPNPQKVNEFERVIWSAKRRLTDVEAVKKSLGIIDSSGKVYERDPLHEFDLIEFSKFVEQVSNRTILEGTDTNVWQLKMRLAGENQERVTKAYWGPFNPKTPTVILLHGSGIIEKKPNEGFFRAFVDKYPYEASGFLRPNIIAIKAQAHDTPGDYARNAYDTLVHQQAVIAGTVLMISKLINRVHEIDRFLPVAIVGFSKGGIEGAWHWLLENTGTMYFILCAYPHMSEIYMDPAWDHLTDHREKRSQMEVYRKAFLSIASDPMNRDSEGISNLNKVYPVLGAGDPVINFLKATEYWAKYNPEILPYGHLGSAIFGARAISDHIAKCLRPLLVPNMWPVG